MLTELFDILRGYDMRALFCLILLSTGCMPSEENTVSQTQNTDAAVENDATADQEVREVAADAGGLDMLQTDMATIEPDSAVCGNGIVDPGEQCDDGNSESEDGCSANCSTETTYECVGEPSVCSELPGCEGALNPCHTEANCLQKGDEVQCTCRQGFFGDGETCTPMCEVRVSDDEVFKTCAVQDSRDPVWKETHIFGT